MKIAADVTISKKALTLLAKHGFKVVVVADEGEADSDWMARAQDKQADVVISNDVEVVFEANQLGMLTVEPGEGKVTPETLLDMVEAVCS